MAYFSQSKDEGGKKSAEPRSVARAAPGASSPAMVSALGPDMLVTGNIICAGSVQILGRVIGDIHASTLIIGEHANVQGNVIAQEMVVHGIFRGTIHANSVKLQSTAVVDGEILNRSLTIEQNAQFEGVSRRLEKPVEAPATEKMNGGSPMSPLMGEVVPISGAVG